MSSYQSILKEMRIVRINKYIASSGVTSRRKADQLILDGKVAVNGAVMKEPGYDVKPDDEVLCEGRKISPETSKTYILLNKPVGYVTTTSDDKNRPTVLDLIQDEDRRIFPVGRQRFVRFAHQHQPCGYRWCSKDYQDIHRVESWRKHDARLDFDFGLRSKLEQFL